MTSRRRVTVALAGLVVLVVAGWLFGHATGGPPARHGERPPASVPAGPPRG